VLPGVVGARVTVGMWPGAGTCAAQLVRYASGGLSRRRVAVQVTGAVGRWWPPATVGVVDGCPSIGLGRLFPRYAVRRWSPVNYGSWIVDAVVTAGAPDAADELRSLYKRLAGVQELRGAVGLSESPPPPGALGPVLDALSVALGPGGAVTAFATTVIVWLRSRRGDVSVKVMLQDGRSVELTAKNVSGLDAAALDQEVSRVAGMLSAGRDEVERLEGP
jgi:hypothetical protein